MVLPVNDGDLDGQLRNFVRSTEPAKTSAYNYDLRVRFCVHIIERPAAKFEPGKARTLRLILQGQSINNRDSSDAAFVEKF